MLGTCMTCFSSIFQHAWHPHYLFDETTTESMWHRYVSEKMHQNCYHEIISLYSLFVPSSTLIELWGSLGKKHCCSVDSEKWEIKGATHSHNTLSLRFSVCEIAVGRRERNWVLHGWSESNKIISRKDSIVEARKKMEFLAPKNRRENKSLWLLSLSDNQATDWAAEKNVIYNSRCNPWFIIIHALAAVFALLPAIAVKNK